MRPEFSHRNSCWTTHLSLNRSLHAVAREPCHAARCSEHYRADLPPSPLQVLKQLYDTDILTEDALLAWADEKADAAAEDRRFLTLVRALHPM